MVPIDVSITEIADASKVPPSRFQKREGSIYATPGSRDGHTGKGRDRDQSFHDKLKSKVCYKTVVKNAICLADG